MTTSDELIRKFINGITKDNLCNSEAESECHEHSEIMASENPIDEESYSDESTWNAVERIMFKKRLNEAIRCLSKNKK